MSGIILTFVGTVDTDILNVLVYNIYTTPGAKGVVAVEETSDGVGVEVNSFGKIYCLVTL